MADDGDEHGAGPQGDDARADALRLVKRLVVLPALPMRQAVLVELLATRPAPEVVRLLATVSHEAHRQPGPPWEAGLFALAGALATPGRVPYVLASAWYLAAKDAGEEAVARLFLASRRAEGLEPPEPEQPIIRGGRTYTLGERKALARGPRSELLNRLRMDPDVQVIRVLLENPRLVEGDVVAIAARRPIPGEVPAAIAASPWVKRPMVRRAIVQNPHTPTDVALRLMSLLATRELQDVAADPALPTIIRAQARDLLAPRRG